MQNHNNPDISIQKPPSGGELIAGIDPIDEPFRDTAALDSQAGAPTETATWAKFRLNQDFDQQLKLQSPAITIPVRKPRNTDWIRAHPAETHRFQTRVVELKDEGETYLVEPKLWPELVSESAFVPKVLFTCISRPGDVLFLWPIRLPDPDGKLDGYNRSALSIALEIATTAWARVQANRPLGAYVATTAPASALWGDPRWPLKTIDEILAIAFKDRVIEDINHPVLRRLRGES